MTTKEDLIAFEDEMTALFEAGQIKAPLHLAGGNEEVLIEIFKEVDKHLDYVLVGWRSHYHALLHGVPPDKVKQAIIDGHSISLAFPEHRFLCSGIVGGIAPIAVGIAAGLKRNKQPGKVWVFCGDMTATTGIFNESLRYATGHDLPVEFVIENNGLSVCTDTESAWGTNFRQEPNLRVYKYTMTKPHVGIGKFVRF